MTRTTLLESREKLYSGMSVAERQRMWQSQPMKINHGDVLRGVVRDNADRLRAFLRGHVAAKLLAAALLTAACALAQPPMPMDQPSKILQQYRLLTNMWHASILPIANSLFWALVSIDWAVAGYTLFMSYGGDLRSWTWGFIRRVITTSFFAAAVIHSGTWMPAIVDGLAWVGIRASGFGTALSPSDVFSVGLWLCNIMLNSNWNSGVMAVLSPGPPLLILFAVACVFLSFTLLAIVQIAAFVQAYICIGTGSLMCALGGSEFTREYAKRYFGLVIGCGLRLMIINMLIGAGMALTGQWVGLAKQIPGDPSPALGALEVAASALIFLSIVVAIPHLIASQLGGAPNFSGFEMVAVASSMAGGLAGGAMIGARAGSAIGGSMASSAPAVANAVPLSQAAAAGSAPPSGGSGVRSKA